MKKTVTVIATMTAAMLLFCSCAGVVTFRNPKAPKVVKAAGAAAKLEPVKFEDFESGALVGNYSYANTAGGASARYVMSEPETDKAHTGQYCAKSIFNSGTNSDWGCGFGSSTTAGFVDASGREYISVWINAPEGTTFYIFMNEAAANGADGEYWNGPDLTGSGKWTEYIVPFDEFHKNIYSGSQLGDNELNKSGIGTVGFQIGGNQGKGDFLVDDIWFK
ncbi:MAG: CIA30 family protein [Spirochaetia bacterium]|nr:CIA30 family protein [Spirochaetia bacterium]